MAGKESLNDAFALLEGSGRDGGEDGPTERKEP